MRGFLAALMMLGCRARTADVVVPPEPPIDDVSDPGPLTGWIGSACASDDDCAFDGGTCLFPEEGYPQGMCSASCDRVCPDEVGHPVTFCVDDGFLPAAAEIDDACHSRCDFGFFPESGCRPGYGCQVVQRGNEPETESYACMPGEPDVLPDCYADLAAQGVRFEPMIYPDRSPGDHPELTCHVEDPIVIRGPWHDVDLVTLNGDSVGMIASCALGESLSDTVVDVKANGATALFHLGTTNCRVIAGTNTLSQHGNGAAIDIWGFAMEDGGVYSLVDDWEHDTSNPVEPGAAWLYDASWRWYDAVFWNVILTPNYNLAHDDHFHVDLSPGSSFIGASDGRYIGPAPYVD